MFMAMTTLNMDSPHGKPKTLAWVQAEGDWYALNGTMVPECGCKQMALPNGVSKNGDAWPCFKEGGDESIYPITLEYYERGSFNMVTDGAVDGEGAGYMQMHKTIKTWEAKVDSECVGHNFRDEGFLRLGAMVIGLTALMFF